MHSCWPEPFTYFCITRHQWSTTTRVSVLSCQAKTSKGSFGCKSVRLNLNWKSSKKNAFLLDVTRVYVSTGYTDVCNLKPSDSNEKLRAPDLNLCQDLCSDSIYGKVRLVLACFLGGQRNIKNLWLKSSWTGTQPKSQNHIGAPDQLYSKALILIWACNRTTLSHGR